MNILIYYDSYVLNPLEMDWSLPLPSYSCSEVKKKIGVSSVVQGIKMAKK